MGCRGTREDGSFLEHADGGPQHSLLHLVVLLKQSPFGEPMADETLEMTRIALEPLGQRSTTSWTARVDDPIAGLDCLLCHAAFPARPWPLVCHHNTDRSRRWSSMVPAQVLFASAPLSRRTVLTGLVAGRGHGVSSWVVVARQLRHGNVISARATLKEVR
jgi:hypothetical protein